MRGWLVDVLDFLNPAAAMAIVLAASGGGAFYTDHVGVGAVTGALVGGLLGLIWPDRVRLYRTAPDIRAVLLDIRDQNKTHALHPRENGVERRISEFG